jgi:hypothetical protein
VFDFVAAGYAYDSGTGKYKIAPIDLLDQNRISIS